MMDLTMVELLTVMWFQINFLFEHLMLKYYSLKKINTQQSVFVIIIHHQDYNLVTNHFRVFIKDFIQLYHPCYFSLGYYLPSVCFHQFQISLEFRNSHHHLLLKFPLETVTSKMWCVQNFLIRRYFIQKGFQVLVHHGHTGLRILWY